MAESPFPTTLFPASSIVESAGTVLFRLSTREICICRLRKPSTPSPSLPSQIQSQSESEYEYEYVLPKGRRDVKEKIHQTAIRETFEETSYICKLLHIDLDTRQTSGEDENQPDEVRRENAVQDEPFMLQIREIDGGKGRKLIWWFVAVEREEYGEKLHGGRDAEFLAYEDAIKTLTYSTDREVVRAAIEIVDKTEEPAWPSDWSAADVERWSRRRADWGAS